MYYTTYSLKNHKNRLNVSNASLGVYFMFFAFTSNSERKPNCELNVQSIFIKNGSHLSYTQKNYNYGLFSFHMETFYYYYSYIRFDITLFYIDKP